MKRARIVLVVIVLAVFSGALAQSLRSLLPANTVAAFGVQGLSQQQTKIQPFIDEFERLGVAKAFQDAFASSAKQAEQSANLPNVGQLPKALQDLTAMDLLGKEAYLAVAISPSNPMPSVIGVARVDAKAQQAFATALAEEAKKPDVQKLTEGTIDFYVATVKDTSSSGATTTTQVAFAQDGSLLAISNNTDALRAVLRLHQGSNEPSFTGSTGYKATLGTLGDGQLVTYLDLAPVAGAVTPLLAAQSMDALGQRLGAALETIGTSASVGRITSSGIETKQVRKLGPSGKDPALHAMLASTTPASTDALSLVPQNALSVSSSSVDLGAWWSYLGGLVASAPQLGITDLNQFVQGMVGIDLKADLFDWSGANVAMIATPSTAQQPGMPTADALGSTVFVLPSKDDAAAAKGLSDLFTKLGTQLASLTNPSGNASAPQAQTHQVGSVTVTTVTLAPTVKLSYTVADGQAFVATSGKALDDTLKAAQANGGLPATLAAMRKQVPARATSFTLTDAKASMNNSSASLVTGIQTFAGLSGSKDLDVAKVKTATDALQKFLDFVAQRLDGSVSYQQTSGDTITGQGMTQVSW